MSVPMALPTKGQVESKRMILTQKNRNEWKNDILELLEALGLRYTLTARELPPQREKEVVEEAQADFDDNYPVTDAGERKGLFKDIEQKDDEAVQAMMRERTKMRARYVLDSVKEAVQEQIQQGVFTWVRNDARETGHW